MQRFDLPPTKIVSALPAVHVRVGILTLLNLSVIDVWAR